MDAADNMYAYAIQFSFRKRSGMFVQFQQVA